MIQKFSEASQQMNPGDIFRAHDVNVNDIKLSTDGNSFNSIAESGRGGLIMFSKEYLQLQGEIIRAEPEVLTAEELVKKYYPDGEGGFFYSEDRTKGFLDVFAENCIDNGQIKEYKRLKPLIDGLIQRFEDWKNMEESEIFEHVKAFLKHYENITPPWEPEK